MITLAQIQATFAALPPAKPSCYLVSQEDYDELKVAMTPNVPTWVLKELQRFERGSATARHMLTGIRLIPSWHVPRGSLIPWDESTHSVMRPSP